MKLFILSITSPAYVVAIFHHLLFVEVAAGHVVSPEWLDNLHGPGRHDCASPELTDTDRARADYNMIKTFGKTGDDMSKMDLSAIIKGVSARAKAKGSFGIASSSESDEKSDVGIGSGEIDIDVGDLWNRNLAINPAYSLVNMPVVYHVMTGQHIPKSNAALDAVRPSATAKQLAFMTEKTNELYNIYDKVSKTSVQWASFVHDQTIYHNNYIFNKDCSSLSDYTSIVTKASEWQFKLHVIICESTQWSGVASFPNAYAVTDVKHNVVRVEYRAVACYDDKNEFLCDQTNGKNVSHTRWWRTRSTVLAHELG
jgi:hypothetical protein